MASSHVSDILVLRRSIAAIEAAVADGDAERAIAHLSRIVPSFARLAHEPQKLIALHPHLGEQPAAGA